MTNMNSSRRSWLGKAAGAGLAMSLSPLVARGAKPAAAISRRVIKPPQLKRGDLIGLVAPSGATNAAFVQQRVKNLESLGFRVRVSANILATRGNTAGSVAERVSDLHTMFADREVNAIWAVRGGSGASQLLPALDYRLIRRNPKIFVGYSDITALHLAILRYANLVTFHGPVASAAFTDYAATQLDAVLMNPRPETTLYMSSGNLREAEKSDEFKLRVLTPGVAEGPLIGGNLSVLSAMIGTPYAPDWKGAILFLEEIREAPYRIDRMLTQLKQSRSFNDAAGIALGVFRRSVSNAEGEPTLTLEQTLEDHFAKLRVPALYGCSFGHIADNLTLPLGIRARLDTSAQTITLLEPAVVAR
jgi:muramoyltetrapeptide carboxypeptidase